MTNLPPDVVAGVDTHAETHHVAVVSLTGAKLGDHEFPTTPEGYRLLLEFVLTIGRIITIGIEGTNSYGAGLTRFLLGEGLNIREVIRPTRAARRKGKSDPIDAYAAAAAALADPALPTPRTSNGDTEAMRILLSERRTAMRARTAVQTQIKSLLVTAPALLRERFRCLKDGPLMAALLTLRPPKQQHSLEETILTTLRRLARRWKALDAEIAEIDSQLDILTRRTAPAVHAAYGVGALVAAQLIVTAGDNPDRMRSEAAFAMLCGVAPIPASSGKTNRHRLNRGGDRQANAAIYRIAMVRLRHDQHTRDYRDRRLSEGKTSSEALRALKRAIAREIFHHLTTPQPVTDTSDLRPQRLRLHLSQTTIATALDTNTQRISRLERGLTTDNDLTTRYRAILQAAA